MANLGVRYATALFDLAVENGQMGTIMEQAQFLCDTFEGEEGALRILTHPLVSAGDKDAFVDRVYGTIIHQDLIGFMKLAIAKNREAFLLSALTKLIEMIKLHMHQITARVVSAVPLNDAQITKISQVLSSKLGKRVEIDLIIDPSKIAGLSVHVDGYFLDRTATTMLKNMKESFVANNLEVSLA